MMETIATVSNNTLQHLLTVSKRTQVASGKKVDQVEGCVLDFSGGKVSILSLTRDLTGLTNVHADCSVYRDALVPVPEIDRVLSILKMHGEDVSVILKDTSNIMFKSGKKQTSLQASLEAKAFAHSPESILAFREKSAGLAERIDSAAMTYTDRNGNAIPAFASWKTTGVALYDALRCDNINGQRLNRYIFRAEGGDLTVEVGDPLYGMTKTEIDATESNANGGDVEMTFDGGLDYLFKHLTGECTIFFFDFTHEEQGYRLGVRFNDGSWAFQAGVL